MEGRDTVAECFELLFNGVIRVIKLELSINRANSTLLWKYFFFALDFGAVGLLFFRRILAMSEKNTKFVPRILICIRTI